MSYSDSFPAVSPQWQCNFAANGGRLEPRMNYSRASTGSYFGTEKVLSSENLLLQSQDFDTTWSASGIGSPTGSQSAPDGTSTAWLITADTGSVGPRVQQTVSLTTSSSYTLVAHVKAGTATHAYVCLRGDSSNDYAYAILEFASPSSVTTGGVGFTGISGSVTALGSSWYRISVTSTAASVSSPIAFVGITDGTAPSSNGVATYTAAGETLYIWGAQLNTTGATVYDSPTTTQIARSYQTKLQTAASGAARFEHSATDGQSVAKGILIEGQSTNLHRYGSDVANWANSANRTVSSNAAVAPDGSLTADLVVPTSTAGFHYVGDFTVSITSGTTYTASFYVRDAGQRYVQLVGDSTVFGTGIYANYDLNDGTYSATGCTASASNVGNSWWRLTITAAATSTGTGNVAVALGTSKSNGRLPSFSGNDYAAVLVWGAQLEASSFASSLVDTGTSSSTATRAADSLSVATADIPGFSEGVGTIVCETGGVASSTAVNQLAFGLNGPASSNLFSAGVNNGGVTDSTVRVYSQTPDGDQAFLNPGTATVGTGYKLAVRYELDNIAASMNGGAVVSDTNGKVPVGIDTLWVGELEGNYHLNSNLKRIAVYNEALSDTNLISLTS